MEGNWTWRTPDTELMDEAELLNLHCTRQEDMEGQSRMRQHSNLHKQIEAFEKLIQHANSKFSREKLYQMLKLVHAGVPYLKNNKIVQGKAGNGGQISSISELRDYVVKLSQHKRKGIHKEEESEVVQYFEGYFRDLEFLKTLKVYFDERIYRCLYEYYYDPLDASMEDETSLDDTDSGHSSQNGSDEEIKVSKPTPRTRFSLVSKIECETVEEPSPERERLLTAVKELFDLNSKWEALFPEGPVDRKQFDEESSYETRMFKGIESFEDVFRIVPDLFVKGFKSNRWAKIWWMQANKLYKIVPDRAATNHDTLEHKIAQLTKLIVKFGEDIIRAEQQIIVFENDLLKVRRRETRTDYLNKETRDVEKRKETSRKRYNDIVKQRAGLKTRLTDTIQGTVRYNLLAMELRYLEHDMVDQYEELKLLEYHRDLLEGDQRIEKDTLPQVKVFCENIQLKIGKLRQSIVEKRIEKRRCEKTIALLKTNCEKMRVIASRGVRASVSPIIEKEETRDSPVDNANIPSFFITQADDLEQTDEFSAASARAETTDGNPATNDDVHERLRLLYKDFDFDNRYRPSSATESDDNADDVQRPHSEEEADMPVPEGFRVLPQKSRRKFINHTFPLKDEEYHLGQTK